MCVFFFIKVQCTLEFFFLICSQSEVNAQCSCSMEEGRKFYQGEREDPEVLLTPAWCKVLSEAPTGVALVGTVGLLSSAAQGAKKITSCKSRMSSRPTCHSSLKHP